MNSEYLYDGKKLSIYGTKNNDSVNSYINKEYNKTIFQNYDVSGNTDDTLRIDITLNTERPKLYQGEVEFE